MFPVAALAISYDGVFEIVVVPGECCSSSISLLHSESHTMHFQAIALLAPRAEESVDGDQHPERDERYARDSDRPAKAVGGQPHVPRATLDFSRQPRYTEGKKRTPEGVIGMNRQKNGGFTPPHNENI